VQAAPISSTMNSSCELSTEEAGPAFMEENLSQNLPSSGLEILTKLRIQMTAIESDFQMIIEDFEIGNLTKDQLRSVLNEEKRKAAFTLDESRNVLRHLELLYDGISQLAVSKIGNKRKQDILDDSVANLNSALSSLIDICKIVSSTPNRIQSLLNIMELERKRPRNPFPYVAAFARKQIDSTIEHPEIISIPPVDDSTNISLGDQVLSSVKIFHFSWG